MKPNSAYKKLIDYAKKGTNYWENEINKFTSSVGEKTHIHPCPFCGHIVWQADPNDSYIYKESPSPCEHLLFIIVEDYWYFRSETYSKLREMPKFQEYEELGSSYLDNYMEKYLEVNKDSKTIKKLTDIDIFTDELNQRGSVKLILYDVEGFDFIIGFAPENTPAIL